MPQQVIAASCVLAVLFAVIAQSTFAQAGALRSERTRRRGPHQGAKQRIAVVSTVLAVVTAALPICLISLVKELIGEIGKPAWEPLFWIFFFVYLLSVPLIVWQVTVAAGALQLPEASGLGHVLREWVASPGKLLADLIQNRTVRFAAAVFIAAAPAYFAFNPPPPTPMSRLGSARIAVMAAWAVLVAITVFIASAHDLAIERLVGVVKRRRSGFREQAGEDILKMLLGARDPTYSDYQWALYVPLPGGDRIGPMPGLHFPHARAWARRESVTGTAWDVGYRIEGRGAELLAGGDYAVVNGPADPRVQEVVALPVWNSEGKTIAVLTAVCYQELRLLSTPEGLEYHARLSVAVARVLVDLLGYED